MKKILIIDELMNKASLKEIYFKTIGFPLIISEEFYHYIKENKISNHINIVLTNNKEQIGQHGVFFDNNINHIFEFHDTDYIYVLYHDSIKKQIEPLFFDEVWIIKSITTPPHEYFFNTPCIKKINLN